MSTNDISGSSSARTNASGAARRIGAFRKKFGQPHLHLAMHAAFPLALSPDLLYRIWANFQRDGTGELLGIPWVAVADILLSSLCDESGYELYEMKGAVRAQLLNDLRDDPRFGSARVNELSDFLGEYVRKQIDSDDADTRDFAQAQRWAALAYARPAEATHEIAHALAQVNRHDRAELARLSTLLETFAESLSADGVTLINYARGLEKAARGDLHGAAAQYGQMATREVGGVTLPIPELGKGEIATPPEQTKITRSARATDEISGQALIHQRDELRAQADLLSEHLRNLQQGEWTYLRQGEFASDKDLTEQRVIDAEMQLAATRQKLKEVEKLIVVNAELQEAAEPVAADPVDAANMAAKVSAALKVLGEAGSNPGVMALLDDKVASLLQSYLGANAAEPDKVESSETGVLGVKFDAGDVLGWAGSFFSWWKRMRPHKWLRQPANIRIGNKVRLALLGNWGTGMYGAPVCARSIERDAAGYQVLLHLGGVFYSGTEQEVRDRFLAYWPRLQGAINRACNSNHEMYAGGHGYFNLTLKAFGQSASYFALHNDYWILAGLDTAYRDRVLTDDQVAWLHDLIRSAGGRRVILFSHHQPFSLTDTEREKIPYQLSESLADQQIFAWYWAHEHRCVIYDRHPVWKLHGRCVGHSGYPYYRDKFDETPSIPSKANNIAWRLVSSKNNAPGAQILDGPNPYIPGREEEYGPHGYMTLEFNDSYLNEIVHAPDGTKLYEKPITDENPMRV